MDRLAGESLSRRRKAGPTAKDANLHWGPNYHAELTKLARSKMAREDIDISLAKIVLCKMLRRKQKPNETVFHHVVDMGEVRV